MKNNFDIKQYLTENKLTKNSLNESFSDNIKSILLNKGFDKDKVQLYINDLEAYGDEEDYDGITDEEIVADFEEYNGGLNEVEFSLPNGNTIDLYSIKDLRAGTAVDDNGNPVSLPDDSYGIYFWFINTKAYNYLVKALYGRSELTPQQQSEELQFANSCKSVTIDGKEYKLVYVGLAEKQTLSSRVGGKHITGRISSSTLRKVVGGIIQELRVMFGKPPVTRQQMETILNKVQDNWFWIGWKTMPQDQIPKEETYYVTSCYPILNQAKMKGIKPDSLRKKTTQVRGYFPG